MQTAYNFLDMSFQNSKVDRSIRFRITSRDIDIIEYILEMKFSTIGDIHSNFFKVTKIGEESSCLRWARERIANLVKTELLQPVKYVCHKTLYIVTQKGFLFLRNSRSGRIFSRPLLSVDGRTYDHDQKVIQIRSLLEKQGNAQSWISERQLSEREEYRKYLPTEFRPDGIYEADSGQKIAFELEIARLFSGC